MPARTVSLLLRADGGASSRSAVQAPARALLPQSLVLVWGWWR
ncbi:hypothetical protein [Kineococcus aurantiacus]